MKIIKSIVNILLIIVFFVSVATPKIALGALYYDQTDTSGSKAVSVAGPNVIGSLVLNAPTEFNSGSIARMSYKNDGVFCTTASRTLSLSTSTSTNTGAFAWGPFPNDGTNNFQTQIGVAALATSTLSAGTYYIHYGVGCNNVFGDVVKTDVTNTNFYGFISNDSNLSLISSQTAVYNLNPTATTTSSTTFTYSLDSYIDPNGGEEPYLTDVCVAFYDLEGSSAGVQIDYLTNLDPQDHAEYQNCFQRSVSGFQHFSDSASLTLGLKFYVAYFSNPNDGSIAYATSTTFLNYDTYNFSHHGIAIPNFASTTARGGVLSECENPSTLTEKMLCFIPNAMKDVLVYLFVPNGSQIVVDFETAKSQVFQVVPIGYLNRIYNMISTSSTSTLPTLSLRMPSSSPIAGTSTLFNLNTIFTEAANIQQNVLVSEDGQSIWTIIMPTIRIIIYLLFFVVIFKDIFKLDIDHDGKADIKQLRKKT